MVEIREGLKNYEKVNKNVSKHIQMKASLSSVS